MFVHNDIDYQQMLISNRHYQVYIEVIEDENHHQI
jgi:hypothetical protein